MMELFEKGGLLMYPITLGAVLSLAIFMERVYTLRRSKVVPDRLLHALRELLAAKKLSEAEVMCRQNNSALATIFLAGIKVEKRRRERLKESFSEAGKSVAAELERYLNAMGTIAVISPLMGLLGTVTGMINVFQQVTAQGVGDPRLLASGIWEALITTAAGLFVAIPTYVGYRHLITRVDSLLLELEEAATSAMDYLEEE